MIKITYQGELVGHTKNKISARDKNGNTSQVNR
jgi:hypothetical protein